MISLKKMYALRTKVSQAFLDSTTPAESQPEPEQHEDRTAESTLDELMSKEAVINQEVLDLMEQGKLSLYDPTWFR